MAALFGVPGVFAPAWGTEAFNGSFERSALFFPLDGGKLVRRRSRPTTLTYEHSVEYLAGGAVLPHLAGAKSLIRSFCCPNCPNIYGSNRFTCCLEFGQLRWGFGGAGLDK